MKRTIAVVVSSILFGFGAVFVQSFPAYATTPAFVQIASTTPQTNQTSVSKAFTNNEAATDANVVVVGWDNTTSTVSSVTDSKGQTYSAAVAKTSGNGVSQAIYYSKNIAAGADTITVTFNTSTPYPDLRIAEYTNLDVVDVGAGTTGSGGNASSGNVTTTNANDLLVGAGYSGGAFTAAGTGYTSRLIDGDGGITEDRNVSSTGSYSATGTNTGPWVMQVAAFKSASGGVTAPVADFSATPLSGSAPLNVTFTDTSTNSPTSWSWTFGDGGTSTAQNPTHTYSADGTYTVSLTATNTGGSNNKTKTGYIVVSTSGTLINCWANPSGNCGFPDATNTGVPSGTTLTNVTGNQLITTNNTVIDSKNISGCVEIRATGVIIKNSHVHGNCFWVILVDTSSYSVTVQNSEIDCEGNTNTTALGSFNITMTKLNIHGCENGLDIDAGMSLTDSYIHNLPSDAVAHTDGIQLAFNTGHNATIQHNTITGKNDAGVNGTSAMIMNTTDAQNVTLNNNLLDGGAFTVYCPSGADVNVQVTNNRFGRGAAYGQTADCTNEANVTGNVFDDDNTPITVG